MTARTRACIADLIATRGKAELVGGELVVMSPTGYKPGRAAAKILRSLLRHEETHGGGKAIGDNVGFLVDLPDRQSFSPDACWLTGPAGEMGFVKGAPTFAVEVRSESDYGPKAEEALARKRADYFAAGTLVVWDVDLLSPDVVRAFRATDPERPITYRRGEVADAEPAVPGWRMPVDELFD
jgi:Uma2 family endonuclease